MTHPTYICDARLNPDAARRLVDGTGAIVARLETMFFDPESGSHKAGGPVPIVADASGQPLSNRQVLCLQTPGAIPGVLHNLYGHAVLSGSPTCPMKVDAVLAACRSGVDCLELESLWVGSDMQVARPIRLSDLALLRWDVREHSNPATGITARILNRGKTTDGPVRLYVIGRLLNDLRVPRQNNGEARSRDVRTFLRDRGLTADDIDHVLACCRDGLTSVFRG